MSDYPLVLEILSQIYQACQKVQDRFKIIKAVQDFTDTPQGQEKLDSICMLLIAIGESVKKLDQITDGKLLSKYDAVDWKGVKGMRDIISHHYFDIDAEEIFWVCQNEIGNLAAVIDEMIRTFR